MFATSIKDVTLLYAKGDYPAIMELVNGKLGALRDVAVTAYEEAGGEQAAQDEKMLYGQMLFGAADVMLSDGDITGYEKAVLTELLRLADLDDMPQEAYTALHADPKGEYYAQLLGLYGVTPKSMGRFWTLTLSAVGEAKAFMELFVAYLDILYVIAAVDGEVNAEEMERVKQVTENWAASAAGQQRPAK